MATMSLRWKLFLIVGPLTMILDQITKVWARRTLPTTPDGYGIPQSVIDGWWDWRLSHNPGSAFGLFGDTGGARVFLSVIGVIAVGAIVWMLKKATDEQRRLAVALGLVAGGAVGNLIDRIAFGVVTDFVVWKYDTHEWPTFNIADVALVVGVGLLFLDIGKQPHAEETKSPTKKSGKSAKKTPSKAKS